MDVKERRPYCSLTKSRRDKERRYTNSSAENEECRVPTQKSYSSSETLKAFDHDSSRLLYGNRVKDLVHREADEYTRQGQNFTLRQLGVCEPATRRGLAFCAEMGLPHRGYSISAGSDADTENEGVMSPEHAMRLWGRGVKSGRSSCLSSRSNSALTLTDTEHENKSDSENGEHLRICPQGYTCCTSEMEENFANKSRSEFEAMMKEAGRTVQMTLTAQHRSFDGYFQDLLNKSEKALYDAFPSLYGELYTQNMKVFKDLYSELRRYYRGSNINLEEALNEFWTRLLERLFKLMNPQYHITDEYLDCMVKHAEQHKPFGEVPRDLKVKATRAFIAARSYAQGFLVGSDVVKKVSQVSLSHECTRAIMKLMYCPHCRGMSSVKPCNNYCLNVVKGCLANQADLNTEWKYLMDSLVIVADRIDGPYNVDTVIGTIHMRISEAISNLQENKDSITAKVLDAKGNLTALKTYWITLPGSLCSKKIMASSVADDKCWNGMTKGSYLPEVMGDGLANQINNPEVEVDITKPDMTIRQQIMQLKIMTNRLGNANIGNDVDFQDASDDMSGSGSGDSCPDDVCGKRLSKSPSTRQPETHAIPKQSGHGISGASNRSLPSAFLLLLSVAFLAAQHLWR